MPLDPTDFACAIKMHRDRLGLTQAEAALDERVELLNAAAEELIARIPGIREQRPELDKRDFLRNTEGRGCLWFTLP